MKPIRAKAGATPNHPTKEQYESSPISNNFIKGNIDNMG
jgi:hypothetical protein